MPREKSNPFAVSMTTLYIPRHMGQSINVGGFELEADEDGAVEVPKEHVAVLISHGLKGEPLEPVAAPSTVQVPGRRGG